MEQHSETDAPARKRRTFHRANPVQRRLIYDLLSAHLIIEETIPEGASIPRGKYEEGWSDARIAKEVGVSGQAVTNIRTKAYCSLLTPRGADKTPRVRTGRFAALEERMTGLIKSEIAAVLDLIAAKPGQGGGGGVTEERLQLVLNQVNGLNDRVEDIERKITAVRAQMGAIAGDYAKVKSDIRQLMPAR